MAKKVYGSTLWAQEKLSTLQRCWYLWRLGGPVEKWTSTLLRSHQTCYKCHWCEYVRSSRWSVHCTTTRYLWSHAANKHGKTIKSYKRWELLFLCCFRRYTTYTVQKFDFSSLVALKTAKNKQELCCLHNINIKILNRIQSGLASVSFCWWFTKTVAYEVAFEQIWKWCGIPYDTLL